MPPHLPPPVASDLSSGSLRIVSPTRAQPMPSFRYFGCALSSFEAGPSPTAFTAVTL